MSVGPTAMARRGITHPEGKLGNIKYNKGEMSKRGKKFIYSLIFMKFGMTHLHAKFHEDRAVNKIFPCFDISPLLYFIYAAKQADPPINQGYTRVIRQTVSKWKVSCWNQNKAGKNAT